MNWKGEKLMRYGNILNLLRTNLPNPITRDYFCQKLNVSCRTVSSDIKKLNDAGKKNGFRINNIRDKGYVLEIFDDKKFKEYTHQLRQVNTTMTDVRQRLFNLEIILLLAGDFITLKDLSERFGVSVSTIKDDLKRTNQFFKEKNLKVVGKPHYGIYISGNERDKRQAIIDLFRMQLSAPVMTPEYITFTQMINGNELRKAIEDSLRKNNLSINDLLLKNVIEHVRLLIFRLLKKNYISVSESEDTGDGNDQVEMLVQDIVGYIEKTYGMDIPDFEVLYLKKQMIGKLSFVETNQEQYLQKRIHQALIKVDKSYQTNFKDDEELQSFLLIHVATLFKRLTTNHQLTNPLIDDVYVKYANVINASLDFMHYLNKDLAHKLSKDELGYVAIYFAASLERQKLLEMENYRNVVVLTQDGRGAGYLLETGISRLFPKSKIKTIATNELYKINSEDDLIVSTVDLSDQIFEIPVIEIDPILSRDNLNRVEKSVRLLSEDPKQFVDEMQSIIRLFDADNFHICEDNDYLSILENRATALERSGKAEFGYKDSVLERELKISTVYEDGIAGPHPMNNVANQEVIDVTILKKPIRYKNKEVQIIFLINIGRGHLTLHQEISRMMIELMKDKDLLKSVIQVRNYKEFLYKITLAIKRS
ncbi:transcription antiterminator [Companilactobacillus futsaii]|uniref:Transcription antiterminator n=3 Tax=Companilactobacillus futsaii TaxID=938155 RepID=A0A5B7T5H2_9LACO|nr:hypothetical protein FC88_GL002351 [Companilactobacillus futsaii JCM 17355]QCX25625.1 transcription antiterminator [Companilactobacillus futsaii]